MNANPGSTEGNSLYAKESKVYPRGVEGRFARLRNIAATLLLGLYYVVPWLTWDNRQAVLFDLPARRFYVFGLTLWPQDFIYLAVLLILAGMTLFFVTAIAGRLWCGYACPQTVWTESFLLIERWIEGDRNKRIKLDQAEWSRQKFARKALKQIVWIALALWTGFTFVAYFVPARELFAGLIAFNLHPWTWFWMLFYGFATYGNAGFLREQVCKYMCPYARFQSAMFDENTLIISYDERRGEPRGSRSRKKDPKALGLGDCINCTLCVQVCPTGIDIREGLQHECIACAACIDACDEVMDKMSYPRGLIRYTTETELHGKDTKVVRPRLLIYATLLVGIFAALVWSIANRSPVRMEVIHDRNALYRVVDGGMIENVYSVRLINMSEQPQEFVLDVVGIPARIVAPELRIPAGDSMGFPLRIAAPATTGSGGKAIQIVATSARDPSISVARDARFFLPVDSL